MDIAAVRIHTVVLPGGKIELSAPPNLREGDEVDVLVVSVPNATAPSGNSAVLDVLDSLPKDVGHFNSADAVDKYVRSERESWER